MQNFRANCTQRNIPIISPATEEFLKKLLMDTKPKTVLELGSAVWYSTTFLASQIKKQNGIIYSFEISYPAYLEALNNFKKHEISNVKLYPFNINNIDFRNFLPNEIDFIFIDAQKNQYGNYMMKIYELYWTKPTIVIDDVIKYHTKLNSLYKFLTKKQINYKILQLDHDDGILIIDNQ